MDEGARPVYEKRSVVVVPACVFLGCCEHQWF